jgi:hypothetical protein
MGFSIARQQEPDYDGRHTLTASRLRHEDHTQKPRNSQRNHQQERYVPCEFCVKSLAETRKDKGYDAGHRVPQARGLQSPA